MIPSEVPTTAPDDRRIVSSRDDQLESLLTDYEQRKQDDTRRMVQRALKVENARIKGAEYLRRFALPHAREVAERLQQAGHQVVYQEFLDAYPPNVRLHLYPKAGAMDLDEPRRWTLELIWSDPHPDRLYARCWTSAGLGELTELGSAADVDIDDLWVREHFMTFLRDALDLA
jgi:hypothetical protein